MNSKRISQRSIAIPAFLYNKSITDIIDNSIRTGTNCFYSMNEADRDLLAATCIQLLGNDCYHFIIGSENFDQTVSYFSQYLMCQNPGNAQKLAETMRKNALCHYEYHLDMLFDERSSIFSQGVA